MFTLILSAVAILSADARFDAAGLRSEQGQSFAELGRLVLNAKSEQTRALSAERMFQAFARYSGPLNVQYPRCHAGRTFEQLQQRDYLQPMPQRFSRDELIEFKAACYVIIRANSPASKPSMEHLVAVVTHDDLRPMLGLLKARRHPGLACIALGRIGSDEAVNALAHELAGECKEQAMAALEHMASPKAVEAMKRVASR